MNISDIGDFLRQTRKGKKLTQNDIAEKLGISPQAVSKWERGENLPDVTFMPDIAKILGISVEQILNAGVDIDEETDIDREFDNILKNLQQQLDSIISALLDDDNYALALDELLPYTNNTQRKRIMEFILERGDYENLDILILYMGKNMKTYLLKNLLQAKAYETIENIIPAFARMHRDLIAEHFENEKIGIEITENFMPFFDANQKRRIQKAETETKDIEDKDIKIKN
ncbi:MAG: helix-turn-helix transcriptional regulator [Defluviitaleaceae bacterium]|nr:helix-turn-helix transcriptional regulator [Defluviitaleaceae bacterium]